MLYPKGHRMASYIFFWSDRSVGKRLSRQGFDEGVGVEK
jgi:hypothetical protein